MSRLGLYVQRVFQYGSRFAEGLNAEDYATKAAGLLHRALEFSVAGRVGQAWTRQLVVVCATPRRLVVEMCNSLIT